jgi:hypothetical protein
MQEFAIAPAGLKPFWILIPIGMVLAVVFGVLAISVMAASGARFQVTTDGLRIRGDLYGRFIPAAQLRVEAARRVDLTGSTELEPKRRTMGGAFPGYQSGWFRLANGEKALLYLSDRRKAVYVPTTEGYSVLISPDEPDAFLAALKGGG